MKTVKLPNLVMLFIVIFCVQVHAQRIVATDATAVLEKKSVIKGFTMKIFTAAQLKKIISPAQGLFVYCLDCSVKGFYVYKEGVFESFYIRSSAVFNSLVVLAQIGAEGAALNKMKSVLTTAQLRVIVPTLKDIVVGNELAYQKYIDAHPNLFSVTATPTEVQRMVTVVNALEAASLSVLVQIGKEADAVNIVRSKITIAQLKKIKPSLKRVIVDNEIAYQNYISEKPNLFSKIASFNEVQTMVAEVNSLEVTLLSLSVLTQIGKDASALDTVKSKVTTNQLRSIVPLLIGVTGGNEGGYQEYITVNSNLFSSTATLAEVQAMVTKVNAIAAASLSVLVQIGKEADVANLVRSKITILQLKSIVPVVLQVKDNNEIAYQHYIDVAAATFSNPAKQAEVQAMITLVNALDSLDVVSTTGKVWMDRNLGAFQVATASSDVLSYGDLFQWGRAADGHQKRNSGITGDTVRSAMPTHALFIKGASNWIHFATENTLWQGVTGVNNPCPTNYRIPTFIELNNEYVALGSKNPGGAFASPLKLTAAGYRSYSNGGLIDDGSYGGYWSSTVSGSGVRYLSISNYAQILKTNKANGRSVRCIKDY